MISGSSIAVSQVQGHQTGDEGCGEEYSECGLEVCQASGERMHGDEVTVPGGGNGRHAEVGKFGEPLCGNGRDQGTGDRMDGAWAERLKRVKGNGEQHGDVEVNEDGSLHVF